MTEKPHLVTVVEWHFASAASLLSVVKHLRRMARQPGIDEGARHAFRYSAGLVFAEAQARHRTAQGLAKPAALLESANLVAKLRRGPQ